MTKKKPVELGERSGIYSVMLQKSGVDERPRACRGVFDDGGVAFASACEYM